MQTLDFNLVGGYTTVPSVLFKIGNELFSRNAKITEVRNLSGHGVHKAKAILFQISGNRTFELIEDITVESGRGSAFGAWWDVPDKLPNIVAYHRSKRTVSNIEIRGLYTSIAAAAERIAATSGFSVKLYLYETRDVHQNDAVVCEVSLNGQRVFDFGSAYDLQFDRTITRVWQLN